MSTSPTRTNSEEQVHPQPPSAVCLHCFASAFGRLGQIFTILERAVPERDNLRTLAGLGRNLADDHRSLAAVWQQAMGLSETDTSPPAADLSGPDQEGRP